MATTKEQHDALMAHLTRACGVGDAASRKMMGEYVLYYRGRLFADLCDGVLLVKPTPAALRLLPDAPRRYPYEGSRTLMLVVEHPEDELLLRELTEQMYPELPEPKKSELTGTDPGKD